MDDVRYGIKVRPARVGYIASVSMETLIGDFDGIEPWWIGWEPEPKYWRPTESQAINRARRKENKMKKSDARKAATRQVD